MIASNQKIGEFPDRIIKGISAEAIQNFCSITGDNNPIHTNQDAAHAAGFDDIVVPGLLIVTLFYQSIEEWNIVSHVNNMRVRFISPILTNVTFTITGHTALRRAENEIVRLKAKNKDRVFAIGEAELTILDQA